MKQTKLTHKKNSATDKCINCSNRLEAHLALKKYRTIVDCRQDFNTLYKVQVLCTAASTSCELSIYVNNQSQPHKKYCENQNKKHLLR